MSDVSSASYSLERPYAFTKHHPASPGVNLIIENNKQYSGADWVPKGITTRVNKNQVALKVQTFTVMAASTTCTVNAAFLAYTSSDGGYISMNEVSCSAASVIWVRSKTNLV